MMTPIETAIVSAFALIAASDGEAHDKERARLAAWLESSPIESARHSELLAAYDALCSDLVAGVAAAREGAMADVRDSADSEADVALVLSAAHAAIVADGRIDEGEELEVREIAKLLGLDPDKV